MRRRAFAVLAITASLLATAGCSSYASSGSPNAQTTQAAEQFRQDRADALLRYVEGERATIPSILSAQPGMYSEVRIEGSLEQQDGTRGIQEGEYAVAWFHYTYASEMDWGVTVDALDAVRGDPDALCKNTVLPAMKASGIEGPRSAVWSYYDSRSEFGAMWSHSCSEWESTAQR